MPQLLVTVSDNAMLPRVRMAIRTLRGVEKVVTPKATPSKVKAEEANIKEAFEQLKLYRKGEMKFRTAEELLEEL